MFSLRCKIFTNVTIFKWCFCAEKNGDIKRGPILGREKRCMVIFGWIFFLSVIKNSWPFPLWRNRKEKKHWKLGMFEVKSYPAELQVSCLKKGEQPGGFCNLWIWGDHKNRNNKTRGFWWKGGYGYYLVRVWEVQTGDLLEEWGDVCFFITCKGWKLMKIIHLFFWVMYLTTWTNSKPWLWISKMNIRRKKR